MDTNHRVIGIDIGGAKISAALFHSNGEMVRKQVEPVAAKVGTQVIDLIASMTLSLIDDARRESCSVVAIGIGVPGIYDPVNKTAWAPNIPEWNHLALWDALTSLINDVSIPLFMESDRSCYILGEVWKGCAQGCTDAIFVSVGTGIGAGILSNGRIVTGHSGIAGAKCESGFTFYSQFQNSDLFLLICLKVLGPSLESYPRQYYKEGKLLHDSNNKHSATRWLLSDFESPTRGGV